MVLPVENKELEHVDPMKQHDEDDEDVANNLGNLEPAAAENNVLNRNVLIIII